VKFEMKEVGFKARLEYGDLHVSGDAKFGFPPHELLVASVAVCSGGLLRRILEKKRLEIENIEIIADVARNEREANRIEKIHLHYMVKGSHLPEEKVAKAIELARKNCPMVRSVEGSIEIEESFELLT